ncbi:DUF6470 family protein [Paenibacillus macerans]|uniref:DUF6470 family protein n=1 Tax=Paenibacillus macerans TaxID=44252 RepID=UPI003D323FCB
MSIPMLQIRQTSGQIAIDADPGRFSIRQPKAELHLTTQPGRLEVQSHRPVLEVDQSRAFAAYNGGSFMEMNDRIYSQLPSIFLQALAKRVEQGNRAAAIHIPGNTIPEIYGEDWHAAPFPELRGEASIDNVDIHFETSPPDIQYTPAQVDRQVEVHKPEISYTRGKLDIYMKQYASIQFIPPALDITW